MNSLSNLLLTDNGLSKLLCDTDECLSYILVLLGILSIFYLVYTSYRPVNKRVRIFGYIWSCFIMCFTVFIIFLHTCIFTILCAIFIGMMVIAVFSTVLENKPQKSENQDVKETKNEKNKGCYVIYPTDDNYFVFGLHAKNKSMLAKSVFKYKTLEEVKDAINICRSNGIISELEDSTGNWVLDVKHPKFRMYLEKHKYIIDLSINEEFIIIKSDEISDAKDALNIAKNSMNAVGSEILYFAVDKKEIKKGCDFIEYKKEEIEEQEVEKKFLIQQNDVNEEDFVNEPAQQEVTLTTDEEEVDAMEENKESNSPIEVESVTLSESLSQVENVKTLPQISKLSLFDHCTQKYNSDVILNHRPNETKTGLPLADTYYTYRIVKENEKEDFKKVCFAYVYEKNGGVLILVRADAKYILSQKLNHNRINSSRFPKSQKSDWYSIIVDETYTEEDIYSILENAKNYCENN